mmetsp:Transcript_46710/g.104997  ORF Transcript_46710/g.104997 Transcript_46710/m.104997 type:complete len:202 (-) Transcript_46710:44-649(-)
MLRHGLLALGLLHGDLLLVDVLHALALPALLNVELVLELPLLQSLVLHVLGDLLLLQPLLLAAHVDLHELHGALLVDLCNVQALLQSAQLLAAVADALFVHVLAQLLSLPPGELVCEVLLKLRNLRPLGLVLLALDVAVVREELAALRRLGARSALALDAHLAPAVASQDVELSEFPPDLAVLCLLHPPLDDALLDVGLGA